MPEQAEPPRRSPSGKFVFQQESIPATTCQVKPGKTQNQSKTFPMR
jgi:hypothetical protein